MSDQRLVKDRGKLNPVSEIDREVEKVKSDWQILRSNNEWMQSKYLANPRTRKLYDTLEKMTREIDKIQTSYLDPKSNHYLQRGAAKTLDAPEISFEKKAGQIKDMLFPKDNKKTINETRNTIQGEMPSKEIFTNKLSRSRSLLSSKRNSSNKSNFNKQKINATDQKSLRKMGSDIQQYLENYISDTEKNFVNQQESNIKEFNTSQDEVEKMLKKLNIQSFDMYDIADSHDEDEDSPLRNIKRKKNTGTSARSAVNEKIEKLTANENTVAKNSSLKEDSMRYMLNANTSVQTSSKSNCNNNAFIEMGLSALNNNLPQDALSRILRSEYLKKDMSLKPM
nr:PREDICTED: putative uncharacterized protein DDB_G0286901 [Megachile rotundata]